jgi:hypothetical protein
MKQIKNSIVSGRVNWRWHLHLLEKDEQRLQLLDPLQAEKPPKFWDGTGPIPMMLVGERGLVDNYPERATADGADFVRIVDPDGTEWKHILEWSASGGLGKAIAGPPKNNPRMLRIVSPEFKNAMLKFALPPHQFYPIAVTHDVTGEKRDYWMFHLLGDFTSEKLEAFWPAMNFFVFEKESKNVIARFSIGSANSYNQYRELFQGTNNRLGYALFTTLVDHPYFIYRQPYDLVWGDGWMALSEEMGTALLAEFGPEYIGTWTGKPTITGFDPEVDVVPEAFLNL